MTLAAADRNGLGVTPTAALSLIIKIYSIMVTVKFSATKSETLFLTPTIAVEQTNSESTIHFAVAHKVFSITVKKQQITKKVKREKDRNVCNGL